MNDCELLKYLIYDFFYYFILLEKNKLFFI